MIAFWSSNLVDQAVLSASNSNALFPLSNITDQRRTKVWRSTSNSDEIVLDLVETSDFDSFIAVSNPIDGFGVSTITIEANHVNSWGAPPFSQSCTFSAKYGIGLTEFTEQSYRFVRIVMTSTLGYCELSKVFLGSKIEASRGVNQSWTYKDDDLSIIKENRYGQKFIDKIGRQRQFSGAMSNLTKDDMDLIFEIYDAKGKSNPFFIQIGCEDGINDINRFTSMVYFSTIPTITNRFFNNYGLSLQMEEAR